MKRISIYASLILCAITTTGCEIAGGALITAFNFAGFWGTTPLIPVSPYYSQMIEDTYHEEERYGKVAVLDQVEGDNAPLFCLDPPTTDEIVRALPPSVKGAGGFAFIAEKSMNNVRIVVEPIVDRVDECRFYPLVGPARLHHCHYKCTVYFTETIRKGWPIAHTLEDVEEIEVAYIDHNHLHMVGNVDTGVGANY